MRALRTREIVGLHALHSFARFALWRWPPLEAKEHIDRVARRFRPLSGVEDARAAVALLFPSGTCLSRAVTVAARLPGAEVVIGIDPWAAARLKAHAWLEVEQERVDTNPRGPTPVPDELARLPQTAHHGGRVVEPAPRSGIVVVATASECGPLRRKS